MKRLFVLALFLLPFICHAQGGWPAPGTAYGQIDKRRIVDSFLGIPQGCGAPTGLRAHDLHKSAIYADTCGNTLYVYYPSIGGWSATGSGGSGSPVFTQDIVLNGGAGTILGYWVNGETIPVTGLGLDAAFRVITQRAIHPTYVAPTRTISGSPSGGLYETGTFISATLSSVYAQNDGGAAGAVLFTKNGTSDMLSNVDTFTLTAQTYFTASSPYAQGACKNNNLGALDCVGRINSGTVTSPPMYYTPQVKRYYGLVSDTTGIGTTSYSNATIQGLNNNLSSSKAFTFTSTPTNQFNVIVYDASSGPLTSILVNNIPALPAFNYVLRNFTNAQGYTYPVYIYWNTQAQTVAGDIQTN